MNPNHRLTNREIILILNNTTVNIDGEEYLVNKGYLVDCENISITPSLLNTTWKEIYTNSNLNYTDVGEMISLKSTLQSVKEDKGSGIVDMVEEEYKSWIEVPEITDEDISDCYFLTVKQQESFRKLLADSNNPSVVRLFRTWTGREEKNTVSRLKVEDIKNIRDEFLYYLLEEGIEIPRSGIFIKGFKNWELEYPEIMGRKCLDM